MSAMAPPSTSLTIVCSTVYSDQREHQSSTSMAFVRGIHRWPVNSPHKKASNAENVSIWWRHHVLTPRRLFQCDITNVIVYITQHPILAVALLDKFGSKIYSYTDFLYFCFVYTEYFKIDYMQDIIRIVTSSNGTFPTLLALCAGNTPVTNDFPPQRPVTRSFDVFFDLRLNKRLSKQSQRRWFKMPARSLWRHWNGISVFIIMVTLYLIFELYICKQYHPIWIPLVTIIWQQW